MVRQQIRNNQSVKEVGAQNYTYDKDNSVEDFLGQDVETPATTAITELRESPSTFPGPSTALLRFICVQLSRTPTARRQVEEAVSEQIMTMLKVAARLNDISETVVDNLRLVPNDPRSLLAFQTVASSMSHPLIEDLDFHVVINETPLDFILADHPVFHYNWYLRNSKEPTVASLINHGVKIFMPVSSRVLLCLYDSAVYRFGSRRSNVTVLKDLDDVNILNSYQALSAESCLYFHSEKMTKQVVDLANRYGGQKLYRTQAANSEPVDIGNDELKSLHIVWRRQIKVERMPSFVRIKRKVGKQGAICQVRQPEVVAAHKLFMEDAHRQREAYQRSLLHQSS